MSRKPKLTKEVQQQIVEYLRAGCYLETAFQAAGIGKSTYHDWMRKGRGQQARKPYRDFVEAVERAMAEDEVAAVRQVERIATGELRTITRPCPKCRSDVPIELPANINAQLRAVTWKLERKYSRRYGPTLKVDQQVHEEMQEVFKILREGLTPEEFARVIEVLDAADRTG